MLAEYHPDNGDYYVYFEDADIIALSAGQSVETDLIIVGEKVFEKSRLCVAVRDQVICEVSRNIQVDLDPTVITYSTYHFRNRILSDELFNQNSGYCETRFDSFGRKVHTYRGTWFHATAFQTVAIHHLKSFEQLSHRNGEKGEPG